MSVRVVRLGSDRLAGEGLRVGTVRRPPRGVAKRDYASENFYDVWLPTLAPSTETVALGRSASDEPGWKRFARKYRAEMAQPDAAHAIALLAALSLHCNFSVGCYCEHEAHCHRSLLRRLLADAGAALAG